MIPAVHVFKKQQKRCSCQQKVVKSNFKVKPGDTVEVVLNEPPRDSTIIPQELDLNILYRDEHVIVINKPSGLVCHPGHLKL